MVGAVQPAVAPVEPNEPRSPVKLDVISPSAIETYRDCARKWAWHKLDGIPKPEGAGAVLGSKMHGQQERWLRDGIPYDLTTREGELAMATLHLVPEPGTCEVEKKFTVAYDGVTFGGIIDFKPRLEFCPPGVVVVGDHKSTSSLGWAKLTKEELLGHPQAPIYALAALAEAWDWHASLGLQTPRPEWVELRWNYVTTRGKPKPAPSWHMVHASELPAAMAEPVRIAREMLAVVERCNAERAAGRDFGALNLPPSLDACGKFGGCPFQSHCQISPTESVIAMNETAQDFLTRLQTRQTGQAPAVPTAPVAPAFQAPPAAPSSGPFVPGMGAAPGGFPFPGFGGQINPPESALPAPAPQAAPPVPVEEPKKKAGRPRKIPVAAPASAPVVASPGAVAVAPALPAVDAASGTNLPSPIDAEQMSEYERERTYQAILGGICANVGLAHLPAKALVERAKEILVCALAGGQ